MQRLSAGRKSWRRTCETPACPQLNANTERKERSRASQQPAPAPCPGAQSHVLLATASSQPDGAETPACLGWKMARLSAPQLVELAVHAAAFLCGIICASALTVTQGEFGSQCILYGSVIYNGTLILSSSSHISLCYFVSGVSILAALFSFCVLLLGIYSCFIGDGQWDRVWLKGSLMLVGAVLFFLLISACVLRVGMDTLCGSIQKSVAANSCQEAQHRPWVPPYHAERFYDNLYTAEAAAWVNLFFWCLTLILLLVEFCTGTPSPPPQEGGLTWADERTHLWG
ncbi:transmembrane protein 179B [Hemicordylus capensis]|uniref:transmembrane protein 179B n=1 Tax=Hemicordylus capensis TaxID=884348 RepID=UPI002303C476|nr:transmembrane protein 179B [Hemicordylus capensis]